MDSQDGKNIGSPKGSDGQTQGAQSKQVQYYSNGKFSSDPEPEYYKSGAEAGEAKGPSGGETRAGSFGAGGSPDGARGGGGSAYGGNGAYGGGYYYSKKRMPAWMKALIIFVLIIFLIMILAVSCNKLIDKIAGPDVMVITANFGYDYIGTVYIEGTIDESSGGSYNHQYILDAIDVMIDDPSNKGLILSVNTPGGSVYASDELYLKIREYQENTGRPVYSSMQSQATSGGYYISAPCDKIIANRNCWTGSIGVTMGSFIDASELLGNIGVKVESITSGANKSMGSATEPMTDEQRAIYQSLVDESYEQFVGIVAEGRGMAADDVKALADGRLYSAQQALDNGLIDGIGTYEDAVSDMLLTYGLEDCEAVDFRPEVSSRLASIFGYLSKSSPIKSAGNVCADSVRDLIELNGTFKVSYMCDVVK